MGLPGRSCKVVGFFLTLLMMCLVSCTVFSWLAEIPSISPIPMATAEATPYRLIAPGLTGVEPPQAAPGHTVTVRGEGGYIVYGEGDTGYNESARSFEITFDGKPVGSLMCYVNFCSADITIPSDARPGTHTIAVETGSAITLEVIAPISPP